MNNVLVFVVNPKEFSDSQTKNILKKMNGDEYSLTARICIVQDKPHKVPTPFAKLSADIFTLTDKSLIDKEIWEYLKANFSSRSVELHGTNLQRLERGVEELSGLGVRATTRFYR